MLDKTNINLEELKTLIGDIDYHNIKFYLYSVNDSINNLLNKNAEMKNYTDLIIQDLISQDAFKELNFNKLNRIFSFFSEVSCIDTLTSGKKEFLVSVNPDLNYERNARFDLVIKGNKLHYYFDVKRIDYDLSKNPFNKDKVKKKIKDKLEELDEKGANVNRPLFLILDCSDLAFVEEKDESNFKAGWTGEAILKILEEFFQENLNVMPMLKKIVGIGMFYYFTGLLKKNNEQAIIFWHIPYTNLNNDFKNENQEIIKMNNIIFEELKKEHSERIPNCGTLKLLRFKKL